MRTLSDVFGLITTELRGLGLTILFLRFIAKGLGNYSYIALASGAMIDGVTLAGIEDVTS
jgi:hypothetical protein